MSEPEKKSEKNESANPSQATFVQNLASHYEKYHSLSLLIAAVSVITIAIIAADECRTCFNKLEAKPPITPIENSKIFWAYGKNIESGYLKHVFKVLHSLGYQHDPNSTQWDLLWAHDYPFGKLSLHNLKPHQKVNHFPGCGHITNKVNLAVTKVKYVPVSFRLPLDKKSFLSYAANNPNVVFVQKDNMHRNIQVKNVSDVDLENEGSFVQEFIDKPLLVSGHKFDIGIYTVITSIDPLRVYIYNGDVLLRFCPVKYYPFDHKNLDKYVVGDDYLPIWEVPALHYYYNELGFGMRESLNAFLASKGQNPQTIWKQIEESIGLVILAKEQKMLDLLSSNKYKSKRNFFELMRFDFVVDENLNVFLLEANMSPNLSSAHYPPNQLLYEQVIYNVFGLVGLAERVRKDSLVTRSHFEEDMIVADKNLATFPTECNSAVCKSGCSSPICQLCKPCLSLETRETLIQAYTEHVNRGDCKRVFPPTELKPEHLKDLGGYSPENQLQYRWFVGKCQLDATWC